MTKPGLVQPFQSVFTEQQTVINTCPQQYTVTGMYEDPALRHQFQRLNDECYLPLIETLEKFAVDFIFAILCNKCSTKDVKLHCGTKISEPLMKAIDYFRTYEMLTNEAGEVVLSEKTPGT